MALPEIRSFRFPDAGVVTRCACHDNRAVLEFRGDTFIGEFDGSIATRVGTPSIGPAGKTRVPLTIVGYTTTSNVAGAGRVTLDFDFTRSVPDSSFAATQKKALFPAEQTMVLNIFMTAEAFQGKLLRNVSPGKLVNKAASSFPPPQGATYRLTSPVELVDAKRGGKVLARILEVNTGIVSSDLDVARLEVGRGVTLLPLGKTFHDYFAGPSAQTPVRFAIEQDGVVEVRLLDRRNELLGTGFRKRLKAGQHEVTVDTTALKVRNAFYQILINGEPRTAPMVLMRR